MVERACSEAPLGQQGTVQRAQLNHLQNNKRQSALASSEKLIGAEAREQNRNNFSIFWLSFSQSHHFLLHVFLSDGAEAVLEGRQAFVDAAGLARHFGAAVL